MKVSRLTDYKGSIDVNEMRRAILTLREAGYTNVLLSATRKNGAEWRTLWEFSGADGGDPAALLGMMHSLDPHLADYIYDEEDEDEDEEDEEEDI